MKTSYTVDQVIHPDIQLIEFLKENIPHLNTAYGELYDWDRANWEVLFKRCIFLVAKRNGDISGIHISLLTKSLFDTNVDILQQVLFYVKPSHHYAAYHLFNRFIDIGKRKADHIITMLTGHTNIKPSTLEQYDFNYLETLYRTEV